jgi:hypothetical protein
MKPFSTRVLGALCAVRCWAAAALAMACGAPDAPAASDQERESSSEAAPELDAPREAARPVRGGSSTDSEQEPGSDLSPAPAGCAGTCEQVCECLATACGQTGRSDGCAIRVGDCRAGCEGSTCRAGDPQCGLIVPQNGALPPDDPEPAPPRPGPGPDPSPVDPPTDNDSRSNDSRSSGASKPGQGLSPGGYY